MVLQKGPWFIYENFLSVQRWQPNFVAMEAKQTFTAVWVGLPNYQPNSMMELSYKNWWCRRKITKSGCLHLFHDTR